VSGSRRDLSSASATSSAATATTPKRNRSRASKGARGPPSEFPFEFHIINDIALGVNATKTLAFGAPDAESCERWVRTLSCLISMYGEQRLPAGRTPKANAPCVPATPRLPTIPGLVDASEGEEDKPRQQATALGRKARSAPLGEPQRSAPLEPFAPALPKKGRPGVGRSGSSNTASSGRSLKRRSKSVGARRDKQAPPLPPWDPARAEAAVLETSETVQRVRSRSLPARERALSLPSDADLRGAREPGSAREPGEDALARNNRIWERFMDATEPPKPPPQQRRRPDWGDDL
jgi:hypothetical protein